MLERPKSAILTLRFVSSRRFSGLRSLIIDKWIQIVRRVRRGEHLCTTLCRWQ